MPTTQNVTTTKIEELNKLLSDGFLSRDNAERTARIFCDAARLVYERQKRLKRDQLKMRDISSALVLADFVNNDAFRFVAADDLGENLGECSEYDAVCYYADHVVGSVKDLFERTVVIPDEGMRCLYKERKSDLHVVASENYEAVRGKRLPWIRHTIAKSHTVCVSESFKKDGTLFRRSYLYFAIVSVPVGKELKISYYVVVTKETKSDRLEFVTAYGMYEWKNFLNVIEPTRPFQRT